MSGHAFRSLACAFFVFELVLAACSPAADPGNARFFVRESVEQLHITHADAGAVLAVYDRDGVEVSRGTADKLGSLVFRRLAPGDGYTVRVVDANPPESSRPLSVMSIAGSTPPQSFYAAQKLAPGFGYIKTRDGTELSAYVTLPGPPENGPYPTVINYSGYDPSKPGMPIGMYEFLCDDLPTLCDPPSDPSGLLISLFGYATVSVNIRGTGCSGGAYDYFEPLQLLDGYDVIETVAAQDFVAAHKVGMTGLSYPGISQLFVATMHPPSLAAITPLSVIGNTATTLRPGGILNRGFAVEWIAQVLDRAAPYGQGWEASRVAAGDGVCAENQLLHGQKVDNVAVIERTPYYVPELLDRLNPTAFAPDIDVPVFLAGAWQDEQTGPFFTTLLDRFKNAPLARFTVYNGTHEDGFSPQILAEWKAFLDLFVAQRIPFTPPKLRALAPLLFEYIYGASLPLPKDRFSNYKTYEEAIAAYRAEPPLRVIFESGGGDDPGAPQGRFEKSFSRWPVDGLQVLRYYFHADGSLSGTSPVETDSASSFKLDPEAGKRVTLSPGANLRDKLPQYDYRPLKEGHAVAFLTEPLAEDLALLGTGSADLWLRSTADDADLQVVLTEVRPDGQEMYVQAGWLRASLRMLGLESTPLWPSPTYLEKDVSPLKKDTWTFLRIPIAGFGHVFRAGSRIRISVDTPGGSRPAWTFDLKPFTGEVTHTIAHAAMQPSSVALPLLPPGTLKAPPIPVCPSLRGQPCRPYVRLVNTPANARPASGP